MENGYASVCTPLMTALTAASSFRAAATVPEVMYRAGLRVSEVVRLGPSDIGWKDGMLEVHRGKGAKDRNVPVDQETVGRLQRAGGGELSNCDGGGITKPIGSRNPQEVRGPQVVLAGLAASG